MCCLQALRLQAARKCIRAILGMWLCVLLCPWSSASSDCARCLIASIFAAFTRAALTVCAVPHFMERGFHFTKAVLICRVLQYRERHNRKALDRREFICPALGIFGVKTPQVIDHLGRR